MTPPLVEMLKGKPVSNSGSRMISTVKKWFTRTATSSEATVEANVRTQSPHQKCHLTYRILTDGLWKQNCRETTTNLGLKWSLPNFCLLIMLFIITLGNTISSLGRGYKDTGQQWFSFRAFLSSCISIWLRFSNVYHTVSLLRNRESVLWYII